MRDRSSQQLQQTVLTVLGTALVAIGWAIGSHLFSQGWSWSLGILSGLLILVGLDCLYAGITGREGITPYLLFLWPWP